MQISLGHTVLLFPKRKAPALFYISRNCLGTSQKQKNEEFKVAKFGLTHRNTWNDPFVLPPAAACLRRAEQGTARRSSAVAAALGKFRVLSPGSETVPIKLPGESVVKHWQSESLPSCRKLSQTPGLQIWGWGWFPSFISLFGPWKEGKGKRQGGASEGKMTFSAKNKKKLQVKYHTKSSHKTN